MDVREKLVDLRRNARNKCKSKKTCHECEQYGNGSDCVYLLMADELITNGVTVQEYGEWVHPKGYVVSNGFLCSKCGHEEASHYPINQRFGGVCIADENGNFFYPPKLNYCPNCGVKMKPHPPKGE